MNVHLSNERNRNVFVGAMSTLEVDVCVVTETWFREGLGDNVMERSLEGSSFQWFGRDRKDQKSWFGDGGVGFIVRKDIGNCKIVKVSRDHDTLWMELRRGAQLLYIAGVYICPEGSTRDNDFRRQLMELEVDIMEFRKKGLVVCMGDFNSRIGSINSVLTYGKRCVAIERTSEDTKIDGSERASVCR